MNGKKAYYATLQDGLIRESKARFLKFYQFEVKMNDSEKEQLEKLLNGADMNKNYEFIYHVCVKKADKQDIAEFLRYTPKK
jgi:hypothetical protein